MQRLASRRGHGLELVEQAVRRHILPPSGVHHGHGVAWSHGALRGRAVPADAGVAVVEGIVKARLKRPPRTMMVQPASVHGLECVVERHEHPLVVSMRCSARGGPCFALLANVLGGANAEEAATPGHRNGVGHLRFRARRPVENSTGQSLERTPWSSDRVPRHATCDPAQRPERPDA